MSDQKSEQKFREIFPEDRFDKLNKLSDAWIDKVFSEDKRRKLAEEMAKKSVKASEK